MPKHEYKTKRFTAARLELMNQTIDLIEKYQEDGYTLTVRQLYYRLVATGILTENNQRQYQRIVSLVNDGRMAGLIDWNAIEDRTRRLTRNSHWDNPEDMIYTAYRAFAVDKWQGQEFYTEVWVEKEALSGVVERVANRLDIPWFACRGYVSQSAQWRAGQRLSQQVANGRTVRIFHLGDLDPSGWDMTRDNDERLQIFSDFSEIEFVRLALNMPQVEEYAPPPNFAKFSDSRATGYVDKFGEMCWELDALPPEVISDIITEHVMEIRDEVVWNRNVLRQADGRERLKLVYDNWDAVSSWVDDKFNGKDEA